MEFEVLKFGGGLIKQFSPVYFTIEEDEFYYKKKKSDDNFQRYHISYITEVYIQQQLKEKQNYVLIIDLNANIDSNKKEKTVLKFAEKEEGNGVLSQIKKILNVKRLQYDMNLFLFNYKEKINKSTDNNIVTKFEEESKNDSQKIQKALKENQYLGNNKDNINKLFGEKLNNFVKLLNQNDFSVNLLDEDTIIKIKKLIINDFFCNQDNKNDIHKENLDKFKKIYQNLIRLFTQIKFCYILKKYKYYDKKYLLENQISNKNPKKVESKNELEIPNNEINEIIENKNPDNIESRISKKSQQNEAVKLRILSLLNTNTKLKDDLKNMILTQNKKLYFCLVCNTLLEKTLLAKSTCNFDSKCTSRSFFYCKKCKINFCTTCVVYQRGMRCSKNHKYFPKPVNSSEDIKCFLCNKSKAYPYYECKYCKEQICSECSDGFNGKLNSCFNCNNELIWRKCNFTSCDRCNKLSQCFYFCICCDYSICLNCSNIDKDRCGAFHLLESINFDSDDINKENKGFFNNYEVLFDGKCSLCNITIGKTKIWTCLRCSMFLCQKCKQRLGE